MLSIPASLAFVGPLAVHAFAIRCLRIRVLAIREMPRWVSLYSTFSFQPAGLMPPRATDLQSMRCQLLYTRTSITICADVRPKGVSTAWKSG